MEEGLSDSLPVEHIPGTEIMRDVGKVHFVHGPKSHQVCVCIPSLYHVHDIHGLVLWLYDNRLTIDRLIDLYPIHRKMPTTL